MLFLGSVGFFVLGHRPVSHTVAGGAGRTEGPFISADKGLAVTLAAFSFRGFVHHADASTALIAPTTESVSRPSESFIQKGRRVGKGGVWQCRPLVCQ